MVINDHDYGGGNVYYDDDGDIDDCVKSIFNFTTCTPKWGICDDNIIDANLQYFCNIFHTIVQ